MKQNQNGKLTERVTMIQIREECENVVSGNNFYLVASDGISVQKMFCSQKENFSPGNPLKKILTINLVLR